jgi:hypothetical protein
VVLPDLGSPAQGSVTGSEVTARLCNGGASAYLQRTSATTSPPNQLQLNINSETADPSMDFSYALPTDATRLELAVVLGPSAAQPGTYTDTSGTCGFVDVCAYFPAPASLQCAVSGGDVCTPGCTFAANSSTTCVPLEPVTCWRASTATCDGGVGSVAGSSWRLTLSSVDPYTPASNVDTSGYELWTTHGTLEATLVEFADASGASADPTNTATLSLSF